MRARVPGDSYARRYQDVHEDQNIKLEIYFALILAIICVQYLLKLPGYPYNGVIKRQHVFLKYLK